MSTTKKGELKPGVDYTSSLAEKYTNPLKDLKKLAGKKVNIDQVPFTNAPFAVLKNANYIAPVGGGKVAVNESIVKEVTPVSLAAGVKAYWHAHGKKKRKYTRHTPETNPVADMVLHEAVAGMVVIQTKIEKRLKAIESFLFQLESHLSEKV